MKQLTDQKPMTASQRKALVHALQGAEEGKVEVVFVNFVAGGRIFGSELTIQTVRQYNDGSVYKYTDRYDEEGTNVEALETMIQEPTHLPAAFVAVGLFIYDEQDASLV